MKYYLIRRESDPAVVGVRNGGAQVEIDLSGFQNENDFNRILDFFDYSEFFKKKSYAPTHEFVIECARLLRNAKVTDFVSFKPNLMACPFMISHRVKSIFDEFHLPEHYYFPVSVYKGDVLVTSQYYLMYCPFQDYHIVDFERSTFYLRSVTKGKEYVQISSQQHFLEI